MGDFSRAVRSTQWIQGRSLAPLSVEHQTFSRLAARAVVISLSLFLSMASAQAGNQSVTARYDISFAGLQIGQFRFASKIDGSRYTLESGSKVKVLFGAFRWWSKSTTTGGVRQTAVPTTFTFDYKIKKKRKRTRVEFAKGRVVKLNNQPPMRYGPKHVPLRQEHLAGVVDPITAIMQMSQIIGSDPCRKTIEVFDGRQRLRLKLSPKGRRRIQDKQATNQPNFGFVCRVQFTPVAGHKRGRNIDYIANNKGIEIVLRPINGTNFAVPYQINVPTMVGSVSITARRIDIVNSSNQQTVLHN